MVSVAAVVRDRKGRFVTDLSKKDFEVVEAGQSTEIVDFRAEAERAGQGGGARGRQRQHADGAADGRGAAARRDHIFANLAGGDEAAVFSFDTMLERGHRLHLGPGQASSGG